MFSKWTNCKLVRGKSIEFCQHARSYIFFKYSMYLSLADVQSYSALLQKKSVSMLTKKLIKLIFIYRNIYFLVGFGVLFFLSNKRLLPVFSSGLGFFCGVCLFLFSCDSFNGTTQLSAGFFLGENISWRELSILQRNHSTSFVGLWSLC